MSDVTFRENDLGPDFIEAGDLLRDGKWIEATLTISRVAPAHTLVGDNEQVVDKVSIGFEKGKKWLPLNKTNLKIVKFETGTAKPDNWIGKTITIYPAAIDAFGQRNVACVRVRLTPGKVAPFLQKHHLGRDLTAS